ncbi:MAG: hypothetical protein HN995_02870 [Candidatus Marinimicrobia bacterium]|jgi:alpha-amylase|nr:hypothetical protein [Candidatus Neomarinimicrobiota bacterium]MBT3575289.1 hypothetical protein [Candidatus Neomarinimicrobiota bacterium]MBT3680388.1 hypothetical protein [Candidatus Neomarinimicrobiota bacterium]MBT3951817.1 hypothetical protein [Candidatus Neomarinimicrobiota bacterium]MBT4252749.1 hypothetical protein [Candidatus Neomarinimicrobiota bacterium]
MQIFIKILLTTVIFLFLLTNCAPSTEPASADIMYFLLIDRFVDGNPENNAGNNPNSYLAYDGTNSEALKHYQGGDLLGVTQSLDSLKALGISMIWISPFIDNSNTDYVGWWPYHGYHPIDFYEVDEHFGTLEDLKALVEAAHLRGLKIIFDMPFNQTAADHPWIDDESKKDWFHTDENGEPYAITDWQNQKQIEIGELHGLPDLAQERAEVSDYLFEVSKYWIEETGCDGFRLDAVKHAPISFWKAYTKRIRDLAGPDFLLLGEVFWGEAWRIEPYDNIGFDFLFDIPGYYAIRNTFNKGAGIGDFSKFYELNTQNLPNTSFATLIDNHDVARFNVDLGENAWKKQLLALGWLMTAPGLPVVYSGTELGMKGYAVGDVSGESQDYLNRLPYPEAPSDEQMRQKQQFVELTNLRNQYPALSQGDFKELYKDWSIYAYVRGWGDEKILTCLNNAATQEFISIPLPYGMNISEIHKIYGEAVIRHEEDELLLRLPPNTMSVWSFEGEMSDDLPARVEFTDRLSADYQVQELFYIDKESNIDQLQIAGDFSNWTAGDYVTSRRGDSLFIEVPLKPGSYQYKFILNGDTWIADPQAAVFSTDPYGGQNSILIVD